MSYTVRQVKQFAEENDVKFVKLTFCDMQGKQKNISLVAEELDSAFSEGVEFDPSLFDCFASDGKPLYLYPDPSTLYVLPWRPQSGRVVSMLCDIKYADKSDFEGDCRRILADAVKRLENKGIKCDIGTACDFYVLKTSEDASPVFQPYDRAGYCDAAPLDKCENIRRDIIFTLGTMGVTPVSSHHEVGKGQNRIIFKPSDPMTAAKNMLVYKSAVRNICVRDGVYATFMPKPFERDAASGMHVSFSFSEDMQKAAIESFAEGILENIDALTLFANPTVNSYRRLESLDAIKRLSWTDKCSDSLLRIAWGKNPTVTLCSPDNVANPYLLFALLLHAGIDGMEAGKKLRPRLKEGAVSGKLPVDLSSALEKALSSALVKRTIPAAQLKKFAEIKRLEAEKHHQSDLESEREQYLDC